MLEVSRQEMESMFQISISQLLKFIIPIVLLFPFAAIADHEIFYDAKSFKKAWLEINGRRALVGKGQSRDGVKVLSVNENEVIVKVHGKRYLYKKKSKSGRQLEEEIKIPFNSQFSGYLVGGYINGISVGFIVDTGASDVVVNLNDRERLKISLKKRDRIQVTLAGGKTADAWKTTLRSVKVGDIEINNVSAVVLKGRQLAIPLLGMSFLNKLEISQSNDVLTLKYNAP